MSKINSFEDINAWQKGRELNKLIYQITDDKAFAKDFDLKKQIRRASISITSNIAEGFERNTDKEFIIFICRKGICWRS
ncbi:MAG: four helix bundle protein [Cellulophaga sp.]|nr:four helix bundle protein [Cellulophaga sp.]